MADFKGKKVLITGSTQGIGLESARQFSQCGAVVFINGAASEEKINNDIIKIRSGYYNYNLTISLAKQLFISLGINENKLIKDMYFNGFDKVINENIKDSNSKLLIEVLDKLTIMYINRRVMNDVNPGEKSLLDKYQIMLNETFTKVDQNYLAFCALITTDELRSKLMKKFNIG